MFRVVIVFVLFCAGVAFVAVNGQWNKVQKALDNAAQAENTKPVEPPEDEGVRILEPGPDREGDLPVAPAPARPATQTVDLSGFLQRAFPNATNSPNIVSAAISPASRKALVWANVFIPNTQMKKVIMWADLATGKVARFWDVSMNNPQTWAEQSEKRFLDISPNGQRVLVAHYNSAQNPVQEFGLFTIREDGELRRTWWRTSPATKTNADENKVYSVVWANFVSDTRFATLCANGRLHLWTINETGEPKKEAVYK